MKTTTHSTKQTKDRQTSKRKTKQMKTTTHSTKQTKDKQTSKRHINTNSTKQTKYVKQTWGQNI